MRISDWSSDLCSSDLAGQTRWRQRQLRRFAAFHFRVAVDDHLADETQQFGGAVATRREHEQLRRRVDEAGDAGAGFELLVIDDVFKEREIGRQAADAELTQRTVDRKSTRLNSSH